MSAQVQIQMERAPLESPQGMTFYKIKRLPIQNDVISKFSRELALTTRPAVGRGLPVLAEQATGIVRVQTDAEKGHMLLHPNWAGVAQTNPVLVQRENAFRIAQDFVAQNNLVTKDASAATPQHLVTITRAVVQQIADLNGLSSDVVFVGQQLWVPRG